MATLNKLGNIIAHCPGCEGGKSTFEWKIQEKVLGVVVRQINNGYGRKYRTEEYHFRLFRCSGCGIGAIAAIRMPALNSSYPTDYMHLGWFYPEATNRLSIPNKVPVGIKNEYIEAERCIEARCYRAAGAMFRSVLDKVFRDNGYKTEKEKNLKQQIDAAVKDGIITEARKNKAHSDIRVLGNDILHEDWQEKTETDVQLAHHYTQRILEDFYDDRDSVIELLKQAKRKTHI